MAETRRNFGETFEGQGPSGSTPLVTLRRLTGEEEDKHQIRRGDHIGLFWAETLVGFMDFDDLFDQDGNRFYND